MAIIEADMLICTEDKDGNEVRHFPVTKPKNVVGLENFVGETLLEALSGSGEEGEDEGGDDTLSKQITQAIEDKFKEFGGGEIETGSVTADALATGAVDLSSDTVSGTLPVSKGGTGNTTGLASSATKLATARTVQVNLASTSSSSFDGTANITPGTTGVLPVAKGGTGVTSLASLATALGSCSVVTGTFSSSTTYVDLGVQPKAVIVSSYTNAGAFSSATSSANISGYSGGTTYTSYAFGGMATDQLISTSTSFATPASVRIGSSGFYTGTGSLSGTTSSYEYTTNTLKSVSTAAFSVVKTAMMQYVAFI